jgi:hypothetical protein
MRALPSIFIFISTLCALSVCADFPIENQDPLYESDGDTPHEIPLEGDSSFSDDVDLDEPSEMPPGEDPEATTPPPRGEELKIDLKNPSFSSGVISTEEGGVISSEGMRIQARTITYTNRIEEGVRIQKIAAEGDLMMEYRGRAFVGSRLEYDFVKKTGILWEGKTFVDIWFLGGDKIELTEDGSFFITNAFITTSETQDNTWEIDARKIQITEDKLLSAKNIRFRFLKIPLLWLPSFKSNLKALSDAPIRYKLVWDKGLGPRLTMRYRIFSWEDLNLFFRLDYRLKRGFGGAFESEYFSPSTNTTFVTRSYAAHDKEFPDEQGPHRYRLQGLYHTESKDEKTQLHLTWDKLSDTRMVGDFKSDDFEINTEKRSHLLLQHQIDSAAFNLSVQPRVNRFDSIDQELPLLSTGFRPMELGTSGIISNNAFSTGYLNYVYANDLKNAFHALGLQSSTRAARLETKNSLYRPFSVRNITLTPSVGIQGIFYSNSPDRNTAAQGIFTYGFEGKTRLSRRYDSLLHITEPYFAFQGMTRPTSGLSRHFYFDIKDGLFELNQLKIGWKNTLFLNRALPFAPTLSADLYTYGFFGKRAFAQTLPKTYLSLGWARPSYALKSEIVWNNEEHLWDVVNASGDFTINEDIAFGLEMRHRSRYDWRKADHSSFILDVARPIPELLDSPVSDGRNTLLTRFFLRLSPKWNCHIQTSTGWGRKNEPAYNTGKVDLTTLLSSSWKLKIGYTHMPNDNRFTTSISLVK